MPWTLNRLSPGSPATHGDDSLNNVEKIQIPATVPGKPYTISVTHKGTLRNGSQAYSLIVSGVGISPYCNSGPTSSAGTRIDEVSISNLDAVNHRRVAQPIRITQIIQLLFNPVKPFLLR